MNIEIIKKAIAEFEQAWLELEKDTHDELTEVMKLVFRYISRESGVGVNIIVGRNLGEDDE
ncbi:hypothetical protein [Faucicola boevrei]|uniref:hypothetical protein n=1 Tax=Faucicola boevrei TaxID=346665 RepID=UPI00037B432D|nr:hypothetical protein [Moraxella boevrei]